MLNNSGNVEINNLTNNEKNSKWKIFIIIILSAIVLFLIIFFLNYMNQNHDNSSDNKQFYFESSVLVMNINDTQQLNLIGEVVDIKYNSSDENIVFVSNSGLVIAKGYGSAFITAYNDDFETTIQITIESSLKGEIFFDETDISIKLGETYQLKLNGDLDEYDIIYEVENNRIVSVSQTGLVTAKEKGITIVNAIVEDKRTSVKIEVLEEYNISFKKNGASGIEKDNIGCSTSNESCKITLPKITFENGDVLGWSTNKDIEEPEYKVGQTIDITENMILYAIVKVNPLKNTVSLGDYEFPKVTTVATRKKKVLVIEIDPYLSTKGKKVSEYLGQGGNVDKMLSNLKDDVSYSSNNNIKVEIVGREHLNEFPTYKEQVTLLNGNKDYRFDEETYLSVFGNGWHGWWSTENPDFKKMDSNKLFDYNYILEKYNLVERKNNNEFDEVWMVSIDPVSAYETAMVGRTAYWINGEGIIKDCDNFVITGFTISRVDSALECLGHASENILSDVFGTSLSYDKDNMNVTKENYNSLNLWQKFTLVDYLNSSDDSTLTGVGAIHFTPNSTEDYDWLNETKVQSNWIDWKNNYPNLTGETSLVNYKTWNSSKDEYYAGRYFHRWWFSLMPHVSGVTSDGYSNNWWDYLYTLDYVKSISKSQTDYTYSVGDKINNIIVKLKYQSGTVKNETLKTYQPNMTFTDSSILRVNTNGEIIAASQGKTTLTYYRDGKYTTINISIV